MEFLKLKTLDQIKEETNSVDCAGDVFFAEESGMPIIVGSMIENFGKVIPVEKVSKEIYESEDRWYYHHAWFETPAKVITKCLKPLDEILNMYAYFESYSGKGEENNQGIIKFYNGMPSITETMKKNFGLYVEVEDNNSFYRSVKDDHVYPKDWFETKESLKLLLAENKRLKIEVERLSARVQAFEGSSIWKFQL